MTLWALQYAIALFSFNLSVNAYKYIEMAGEERWLKKQVALFRCTLNTEIEVYYQRPSPISSCTCKTITSKSEHDDVYSSVNFYRVVYPKKISKDVTITFDGSPQPEPLPTWTVGDDFSDPVGPAEGLIFQPVATEYVRVLETLLTMRLTAFLPEGEAGQRLIKITARYYAINDMKAFTDSPVETKGYMEGFVHVLQIILQAKKPTVSAKSSFMSRIPKFFRRIPRFRLFGGRKPQPTAVNTAVPTIDGYKSMIVMFVQKMFDPCVVLNFNPKSSEAQKINQYCKTYCEFLTLVVERLSLRVSSECTNMQRGECDENKFCICYGGRPRSRFALRIGMKRTPPPPLGMRMIFCNNKIRLKYLLR